MINRILYLGYYFKNLNKAQLDHFMNYVHETTGASKMGMWSGILFSSLRYNTSLLEYFQFNFYKIPKQTRDTFAGTGYMYEYQLKMNPKSARKVLADKLDFLKEYKKFIKHKYASLEEMRRDKTIAIELLNNRSGKIVLKSATGQCGNGIEVSACSKFTPESLIKRLEETGNDFAEEFVVQHPDLMRLSPAGLNTVRIITQLNKHNQVDIIGARLRITVNSPVDNMAAGNIAAPIDIHTGKVTGPGVYSDITKQPETHHPVTGIKIEGLQIPNWKETIQTVSAAAMHHTANRSIGWDVAITETGPDLIEGNHDWCKLLWQLPVNKGLKSVLEGYRRGIT